ncbi:hypothetical protein [Shewanella xiamenensis]|uniref:hypothetical protein n=1 Tax=Shewanella xiamenensis TaxID=332186 RepID=UPI001CC47961|nr:hypothetical protein [Shewanella xiamenensis]BDA60906.1 hypothetical protein NUITMVS1_23690 [Shewanella xiamenensis]
MGFFSSISSALSQINAADKPENQQDALFADFDETVAKLQQFDLEASDDKGNVNSSSPAPQSRIKK